MPLAVMESPVPRTPFHGWVDESTVAKVWIGEKAALEEYRIQLWRNGTGLCALARSTDGPVFLYKIPDWHLQLEDIRMEAWPVGKGAPLIAIRGHAQPWRLQLEFEFVTQLGPDGRAVVSTVVMSPEDRFSKTSNEAIRTRHLREHMDTYLTELRARQGIADGQPSAGADPAVRGPAQP
jgi:hypothetical protein